jgi:hypothetical protein
MPEWIFAMAPTDAGFSLREIVGKWTHRVDSGRPSEVKLLSGGVANIFRRQG